MDKNQAMIDYLMQNESIAENPLFLNFINAKEDNKQIITVANDKSLNKTYLDGSVLKRYTLTIVDFKSVVYNALVTDYDNETVEDLFDVQEIIDWVETQRRNKNFPDFGDDCLVENIKVLTDNPNLNGVDTSTSPAQAKYSFSIQVDYIDYTDCVWS